MSQLVGQPTNSLTHRILADYYMLPAKEGTDNLSSTAKEDTGQILIGTTVDHLATLPRPNRIDPLVSWLFLNY